MGKIMNETYDFCIVGVGACGGLLAKELSERGFSVIGLDAGPRYKQMDFVNDEADMLKLFWNEPRSYSGKDPAHIMSGFGVGGGTLVWCGVSPRFHESDFRIHSLDGVGVDWPITYKELAPYYHRVEQDFGVSGNHLENPWTVPRGPYPMPAIEWSWANQVVAKGVEKLGAKPMHGPLAITSKPYRGREECNKCGFCISGCPSRAKSCTLHGYVPEAEANGAMIIAEAFVFNICYDAKINRVTGVEYYDEELQEHRVKAKTVILSAHPMETTRLLLLSANSTFPQGLANSSGLVGKNFMYHYTNSIYGIFEQKMNAFKGPIMGNLFIQDWYETDGKRGFARGYTIEDFLPHPFYYAIAGPLFWGQELKNMIKVYDHAHGLWTCGEGLPNDNNTLTLSSELKDHRGLPVVEGTHEWLDNDRASIKHAIEKSVAILEAAGAKKTYVGKNMGAHPMGTARMGVDPNKSVVNSFCQAHDISNLFICDPSVLPTGGGTNHTLTSMAISSRAGHYMTEMAKRHEL